MPSEILTPVEFDDGLMNVVEINARLCYLSEPGGDRTKFFKKLLVAGHWSVFEHANVSVVFRDVSRGMTHQLVRHRHAAFSETSTRYVTMKGVRIRVPEGVLTPTFIEHAQTKAMAGYVGAKPAGKDVARQFLPIGMMTNIGITANLREWHTIMVRRTAPEAHWEIREEMLGLLVDMSARYAPVFDDLVIDGDHAIVTGEYKPS